MSDVELDYQYLTQNALRRVVYDVLTITAELGAAPGEHHFYIEFLTQAEGVTIPRHLIDVYPERMTIVLQHQFENLIVREESFSVSLWFKGKQADLTIPYEAVTSFADPSVEFGMRFDAVSTAAPTAKENSADTEPEKDHEKAESDNNNASVPEAEDANDGAGADVVELDAFRKK